ncbi:MAG TPA: acyltransferase family protein [Sedimentisphaerales bacterium]|nr:acyltransferase family protein [Sedimentisphaerales bacterium]HNU28586.1 acyltransferase family protein [Sedimentisphaerales bacterium]
MASHTTAAGSRLAFIDNLRTVIIVLVIMVHLSCTYGGEGSWYYKEGRPDPLSGIVLTLHNGINQSFFMGCLFLVSGYFTPASLDRKGPRRFLIDRLLRLGIPMLFYDLVIHPFMIYWLARNGMIDLGSFRNWAANYYTTFHIGRGPLWFVEALLLFSIVYIIWRLIRRTATPASAGASATPRGVYLAVLAASLGIVSFLVRLWKPVGWSYEPLNFQFPFFPQYIVMFILGIVAYRRQWLTQLPTTVGRLSLILAAVFAFVLSPLMVILGGGAQGDISRFLGGPHWQALAMALWEQSLGVLLTVGLLVLFRERLNRYNRLSEAASASSYAVYVIHAPVLLVFTLMVPDIHLYPLLKFALATVILVPLCFGLAAVIRKFPGVRRVL